MKFLSLHRTTTKYMIAVMLIIIFGSTQAHAAECTADMTGQVTNLLNYLLSFVSWIWVFLASLAGKIMTNGLVYGEFMNLDKVLYYLWNISRTFANFLIVGLLLYNIVTDFTKEKELNSSTVGKHIMSMVGGVILINASRFILGAMVDMSTILTTAVGSLPSTYIASDGGNMRDTIYESMGNNATRYQQKINLSADLCGTAIVESDYKNNDSTTPTDTTEEMLDKILPNETSITGPLMYLGIGVLRVQDYQNNSNNPNAFIDNLFVVSVRLAIVLSFTFSLILLIVINIFRLVTIRFAAGFLPILIIIYLSGQKALLGDKSKYFSISNIAKAIFAPVLAVGLMSLALIVIIAMQGFLQYNNNIERGDAYISSSREGSRIGVSEIFETTIGGDILGKDTGSLIKNTFTNILLIIFTLFILFGITKLLASFLGEGIGGDTIKKISEVSGQALGSMRMIPTPRGAMSANGIGRKTGELQRNFENKFNNNSRDSDNIIENQLRKMAGLELKLDAKEFDVLKKLQTKFSNSTSIVNNSDYDALTNEIARVVEKGNYKKQNLSIANMREVAGSLSAFLKYVADKGISLDKFGAYTQGSKLDRSNKEDTIEQFIEKNYKNNKKFFDDLYESIGGDKKFIDGNGKGYWDKPIRWKGEPIQPQPQTNNTNT